MFALISLPKTIKISISVGKIVIIKLSNSLKYMAALQINIQVLKRKSHFLDKYFGTSDSRLHLEALVTTIQYQRYGLVCKGNPNFKSWV